MQQVLHAFGGYRKTRAFAFTCLAYHATCTFCQRNYPYQNDPLGKTSGQMIGAARSARQNIVEGSSRAGTSRETELKLYDVAKGSLQELAGDYEAFLVQNGTAPWSVDNSKINELEAIHIEPFVMQKSNDDRHEFGNYILRLRESFGIYLEAEDPILAANSILWTIDNACKLLYRIIETGIDEVTKNGGFAENLTKARLQCRSEDTKTEEEPLCPICGKKMRKLMARRGKNVGKPFWSCIDFPNCNGSRNL